ncbi:MAG: DUF3302 domain-containing protein [Lacipirellulaceae bacterium]
MDYPFISIGPTLHVIALLVLFAMLLVGIAVAILLASLPGRIAAARNHPQTAAVNACGWLGLPTGILWVVAFAWAFWKYQTANSHEIEEALSSLEATIDRLENQQKVPRS